MRLREKRRIRQKRKKQQCVWESSSAVRIKMVKANSQFDNHPSLTCLCDSSESSDASECSFENSSVSEIFVEDIQRSGQY